MDDHDIKILELYRTSPLGLETSCVLYHVARQIKPESSPQVIFELSENMAQLCANVRISPTHQMIALAGVAGIEIDLADLQEEALKSSAKILLQGK